MAKTHNARLPSEHPTEKHVELVAYILWNRKHDFEKKAVFACLARSLCLSELCPVRDYSAPVVPRQEEISGAATAAYVSANNELQCNSAVKTAANARIIKAYVCVFRPSSLKHALLCRNSNTVKNGQSRLRTATRVGMRWRAWRRYNRISVKQCAIDTVRVSKLVDADMSCLTHVNARRHAQC